MEQQNESLLKQSQPGIAGEKFKLQFNKNEFSTNLFEKEMFAAFFNKKSQLVSVKIFTDIRGYKQIKQIIKNLQTIKRLYGYETTE